MTKAVPQTIDMIWLLTVVFLLAAVDACAMTWNIALDGSGDAPTIQAGIDSAAAGDTVLLADGLYVGEGNRGINFRGKSIVVASASGSPELCIIDCQSTTEAAFRGFVFRTGEQSGSVLEGVTIKRG